MSVSCPTGLLWEVMDVKSFRAKCVKTSADASYWRCCWFLSLAHCLSPLLVGKYDNSVDVYAFGILFWYICSGSIKLPEAFERCASKDHLWNNVRRGKSHEPDFAHTSCGEQTKQCSRGLPSPSTHLNHHGIQKTHLSQTIDSRQHLLNCLKKAFFFKKCLILQLPMPACSSLSSQLLLGSNVDVCLWNQSSLLL